MEKRLAKSLPCDATNELTCACLAFPAVKSKVVLRRNRKESICVQLYICRSLNLWPHPLFELVWWGRGPWGWGCHFGSSLCFQLSRFHEHSRVFHGNRHLLVKQTWISPGREQYLGWVTIKTSIVKKPWTYLQKLQSGVCLVLCMVFVLGQGRT